MGDQCEHMDKLRQVGVCGPCKAKPKWMVFRIDFDCMKQGAEDRCCGYFWGPAHPQAGQKCEW